MRQKITAAIEQLCEELFDTQAKVELTRPEEQFGDYSTNVALQLAKPLAKNPREVAEALSVKLRETLADSLSDVTVAGPGFINLTLNDTVLLGALQTKPAQTLLGKVVIAEYSDPNPFKILHAGHVYTTVVGDAIANLMEVAGGEVKRVNYGGDVGLHVGKTMWAMIRRLGGELPAKLDEIPAGERSAWMAAAYVEGNTAYDDDEAAKSEIVTLNKRVYQLHNDNDHDSPFAQIYWTCRQWSYEAFDAFYERLGTKLDKYYPESEVANSGLKMVKQQIGQVFENSDGAVIFKGEPFGLHTRVFINKQGIPTYEAKEVGLIAKKFDDYHFDRSIVVTANEQEQYMAVVMKAIEQFMPDLVRASTYVPHGMVKLSGGVKMSSRRGNIIPATEVLDVTAEANRAMSGKDDERTVLGAIKYAFLKVRIGGDLVYEPKESVSLEGNSGPYLQYAHARAQSILRKAPETLTDLKSAELQKDERSLVRKISEYSEVVDNAIAELMPHHVCTYLYELAQTFNRFYEHNRVIDDERQGLRLSLVKKYAQTLHDGLQILGIHAPDKM